MGHECGPLEEVAVRRADMLAQELGGVVQDSQTAKGFTWVEAQGSLISLGPALLFLACQPFSREPSRIIG